MHACYLWNVLRSGHFLLTGTPWSHAAEIREVLLHMATHTTIVHYMHIHGNLAYTTKVYYKIETEVPIICFFASKQAIDHPLEYSYTM